MHPILRRHQHDEVLPGCFGRGTFAYQFPDVETDARTTMESPPTGRHEPAAPRRMQIDEIF